MRPAILAAALFAASSFTIPLRAVDPGLMDLVGPDANFVLGIRVAAIADSPLIQEALTKAQQTSPDFGGMMGALGPNPLEGLEEVLLLGRMDGGKDVAADGLLIARGDFSGGRILDALCAQGCKREAYAGFTLHHAEHEGEQGTFVKLDDNYAVAGKADSVKALLRRRSDGRKPALSAALTGWARDLSKHHLWLAAKGPFEAPSSDAGGPPIGQMTENIESVGLGVTLADDVLIGLSVESDTEQHADELFGLTQGLLMMFSASQSEGDGGPNPAAGLLDKLQLRREARRVIADLRVPREQIESSIRSGFEPSGDETPRAESTAAGAAAASATSPAQAPAPAAKPRSKGPIRIYGLGDEPIEVSSEPR
jgi:hypothetical protein